MTGKVEKVRVTSRALFIWHAPRARARARFRMLTAEGMEDLGISFDRHLDRAMGRLG